MAVSCYAAAASQFVRNLHSLAVILEKAEAFAARKGVAESTLLEARLAEDMFPLVRQVQIVSDMSKGALARLAGIEAPAMADDETSFAALRDRLARTVAFIESVEAGQLDGDDGRPVVVKTRSRGDLHFTAQSYLWQFALPNFFFHYTTAYDILRQQGLEIGKADFLGSL